MRSNLRKPAFVAAVTFAVPLRGVALPFPGRWHMRIDALVTDFQRVTLDDDFEVR